MWDWLEKALKKAKAALGFGDTPEPVQPCPLLKTALIVIVVRRDNEKPIEGATVKVTGPTPGTKTTDSDGLTRFKPVDPGAYKIDVTLPASLKDEFEPPATEHEGVGLGYCSIHVVRVAPLVNVVTPVITTDREELRGKVAALQELEKESHFFQPEKKEEKDEPEVVEVKLTYKETRPAIAFDKGGTFASAGGQVSFFEDKGCKKPVTLPLALRNGQLKSGHTVYMRRDGTGEAGLTLTLEKTQKDRITLEGPVDKKVKVKPVNRVTPYLKVEHLVVLRDQELCKEQRKNDTVAGSAAAEEADWIRPDPTRIELSAAKGSGTPEYTGKGTLSFSPENVKAYTDEECKTEFKLSEKIDFAKLTDAGPFKLWLRGKTAGKFTAKLELDPSNDPNIKVDEPAKGEMGCVELKLKLHHYKKDDVNKAVEPDTDPLSTYWDQLKNLKLEQAEMTKSERIGSGRILHLQKDKNHARAKLIIEKADASHWPDAASKYEIILSTQDGEKKKKTRSGDLKLFTLEEEGDEKALPHKMELATVKGAEQTLWVEGAGGCTAWRGVRLAVGFDRPEGGLSKTAKADGDWAAFTVVEISEVKVDYTPPPNKPVAWDSAQKRFYINYKTGVDGRKVKIAAKLSQKFADVTLHLMLAADENNLKTSNWGIDLPSTWKWKDISADVKHKDQDDRKKLLHMSAKTDVDGKMNIELTLSRFGGDIFRPSAYIDQDPHLAKYVHGHADLSKRKPVQATDSITVWRKFWYQTVKVEGINAPAFSGAEGQYDRVKATMDGAPDVNVTRATVNTYNPKAIYPMYMVRVNGGNGDALLVSDTNKAQFFTGVAADASRPLKIPILVCDAQWDAGPSTAPVSTAGAVSASSFPVDLATSKLILDPPLQGGNLMVSGTWVAAEWDAAANGGAGAWINRRNGNLAAGDISVNSARDNLKKVTVSVPAGVGATTANTRIQISNLVVQGANGPYLGESFQKRILAVYDPNEPADFQNTIAHEIGHAFKQVIKGDPAGGVAGVPAHPKQMDLGQGNHCREQTNKCVMYDSGPIAGSLNRYCDVCHPYLLVNDMSEIK